VLYKDISWTEEFKSTIRLTDPETNELSVPEPSVFISRDHNVSRIVLGQKLVFDLVGSLLRFEHIFFLFIRVAKETR